MYGCFKELSRALFHNFITTPLEMCLIFIEKEECGLVEYFCLLHNIKYVKFLRIGAS